MLKHCGLHLNKTNSSTKIENTCPQLLKCLTTTTNFKALKPGAQKPLDHFLYATVCFRDLAKLNLPMVVQF
jgi:hypothetical protein